MPDGTATAHLFRPKLVTTLGEGYSLAACRRDAAAGLTVAIVALPLSMAIAVASGVSPERGLYTSIIGGFVVSALGGSRYQIGGPAGAFIVLVAAAAARLGIEGLLLAVAVSGALLVAAGALRVGALVRHIPHSVVVGFTAGIAVTILASQIRDLAGLRLAGPEPGPFLPKLAILTKALPTLNPAALAVGGGAATLIFLIRRVRPAWPAMLIAVAASAALAAALRLPVATIGSRFGGIPGGLPSPHVATVTPALLLRVLPTAFSFTLLGGVESLLSAKVADAMTGRKHRSNMELVAQGVANVASALFGGISVTGTIARTATNIRAGARSPMAGMMHAAFLLIFILAAAPLARFTPMAALAGVLVVVCWNMAEKAEFVRQLRDWRTGTVLLTTFGVTLAKDLTFGIVAGWLLAAAFGAIRRGVPEEGD